MGYEVHLLDRICTFCLLHIPCMALIKSYCTKFFNLFFVHILCCHISLFTSLLISPEYYLACKLKVVNIVLIKTLTTEKWKKLNSNFRKIKNIYKYKDKINNEKNKEFCWKEKFLINMLIIYFQQLKCLSMSKSATESVNRR